MSLADDVRQFLRSHKLHLSKEMGQHFLIDPHVLRCIVETADMQPYDHVIEIGAGIGILTREILKHAQHVTAIECDRRLIPLLDEFIGPRTQDPGPGNLTIVQGNAIKFPYPKTPYKIVANIPYQITSNFLRTVFRRAPHPPTSLTLLIQKEVAERITGKSERSLLTLLASLYGTPRIIRAVPPGAFLPPPKVTSAVIHIACFPEPLADKKTLDALFELAAVAFRKKRKMLRASLGKSTRIAEALSISGIDPTRRPETLTTDEWLTLARLFPPPSP